MADCTELSMVLCMSEVTGRESDPQPLSFLGRCHSPPRWILLPLQSALPTGRSRAHLDKVAVPFPSLLRCLSTLGGTAAEPGRNLCGHARSEFQFRYTGVKMESQESFLVAGILRRLISRDETSR